LDLDLQPDCEKAYYKRHAVANFKVRDSARTVAVMSVHLVKPSHLKNDQTYRRNTYNSWVQGLSSGLELMFDADAYVVGGDFNVERCASGNEGNKEGLKCNQQLWWRSLRFKKTYLDSVFRVHGTGGGQDAQDELDHQYKDGNKTRSLRIDAIWGKNFSRISRASHDLSCGKPDNCDRLNNPQRYADHRLVWSVLGMG
jgi:hypothetical protein